MNILNRLLAIVLLLIVLVGAAGTVAVVSTALSVSTVDQVLTYAPLHTALTDLQHVRPHMSQLLTVAIAAAVGLLALVLLVLELRAPHRERRYVVNQSRDGDVSLGYGTLRKIADGAARSVVDVNQARCDIDRRQKNLRVRCRITAAPFSEAGAVGQRVETAVRDQLETSLGNPVEHVTVTVDVAPAGTPVRVH